MNYVNTGCNNEDGDQIAIYIVTARVDIIHHSITFVILEQQFS